MDHRKPVASVRGIDEATRTASIYLDSDAKFETGAQLYLSPFKYESALSYKGINVYGDVESIQKLHTLLESEPPVDNGGPAFPWGEHGVRLGGINMLDYFAGEALPACMKILASEGTLTQDGACDSAYGFATAMMRARQKVQP